MKVQFLMLLYAPIWELYFVETRIKIECTVLEI